MATAPKVTKRIVSTNATTGIYPNAYESAITNVSTTAHIDSEYVMDSRNRKERRKAESSKKHRRGRDTQQTGVYNAFRGY